MKTAVILFNLGGPDRLESVKPFLYNLFSDPAIIPAPWIIRKCIAWLISSRRNKTAMHIYSLIGGKSPIVEETAKQVCALQDALDGEQAGQFRVFQCQRYWHPLTDAAVEQVAQYNPDRVILLPLYPQFSTTTTASSIKEWKRVAAAKGLEAETTEICCYFNDQDFIAAHVEEIKKVIPQAEADGKVRLLFSAHGLPEKVIAAGDPYQWQVEQTVEAIMENLGSGLDYTVCYQSRVGPMQWIKPYTDEEIQTAAKRGESIIIVPIAFVSEHSETLVELDIEYRKLAEENGAKGFHRVPALGINPLFISALKNLVLKCADGKDPYCKVRQCPDSFKCCSTTNP